LSFTSQSALELMVRSYGTRTVVVRYVQTEEELIVALPQRSMHDELLRAGNRELELSARFVKNG
jgi:hypothetical protein